MTFWSRALALRVLSQRAADAWNFITWAPPARVGERQSGGEQQMHAHVTTSSRSRVASGADLYPACARVRSVRLRCAQGPTFAVASDGTISLSLSSEGYFTVVCATYANKLHSARARHPTCFFRFLAFGHFSFFAQTISFLHKVYM